VEPNAKVKGWRMCSPLESAIILGRLIGSAHEGDRPSDRRPKGAAARIGVSRRGSLERLRSSRSRKAPLRIARRSAPLAESRGPARGPRGRRSPHAGPIGEKGLPRAATRCIIQMSPRQHRREMALDDREQEILAQIERQFYEDDPDLARAVRRIERPPRIGARLALAGVIVGLALVIVYVKTVWLAALWFGVLVVSATALVNALRARGWRVAEPEAHDEPVE